MGKEYNIKELKSGVYKYVFDSDYSWRYGEVIIILRNLPKSYEFNLIKNTVRYDAPQIDDMFRDKRIIRIKKDYSPHALNIWGEENFTLYPYRVGVPYYFEMVN